MRAPVLTRAATRRQIVAATGMLGLAAVAAGLTPRPPPGARRVDLARDIPDRANPWEGRTSGVEMVSQLVETGARDQELARVYGAAGLPDVMLAAVHHPAASDGGAVHRPEVCYAVAGFAVAPGREEILALASGLAVGARRFTAVRGERREEVLYWTRVGDAFPQTRLAQRLATLRSGLKGVAPDGLLLRVSHVGQGDALAPFCRALYAASDAAGRRLLAGVTSA